MRFSLISGIILAVLLFIPGVLLAGADDRAEVLAAIEEFGRKATEFETRFQEMTRAGTLYRVPEDARDEGQEVNWEQLLRDIQREVGRVESAFGRAVMHNEPIDSTPMKKLVDEFEAVKARLVPIGYFSMSRLDETEIPEGNKLMDAVRNTRRGFCLVQVGTALKKQYLIDSSASYLADGPKILDDLLRAVKVADAGDPKVTADLANHPKFLAVKAEIDRLVAEAAKLTAGTGK